MSGLHSTFSKPKLLFPDDETVETEDEAGELDWA
jgi:hypothetical protein